MTDTQLFTIALVSGPTMIAVLIGILINNLQLNNFLAHIDNRFDDVDRGFDDMREMWRCELQGAGEVLDPRRKHLEER